MAWFKRKKGDPLSERADALVSAAQAFAVTGLSPMQEQHTELDSVDLDKWQFFTTSAIVFMAATRLNNMSIDDAREDALMERVQRQVEAWDRQGSDAFFDCKTLFEREYDRLASTGHPPQFVASDAVGKWLFWNLFGRPPESREDVELLRTLGVAVTHFAFHYWD